MLNKIKLSYKRIYCKTMHYLAESSTGNNYWAVEVEINVLFLKKQALQRNLIILKML